MKYVALLRGINVGGNNKVPMKELQQCFEDAGYDDVQTYINSGNVIFNTKKIDEVRLAAAIEGAIEKWFGFGVRVVVRTGRDIQKIAAAIPADWENKTHKTDILFLWDGYASKSSVKLINPKKGIDTLIYVDGAIVWHLDRNAYGKSAMNNFIGTELYKNMTARNVNTVRKLAGLLQA